ncbi:hypothetical protein [Marinoscillum furvescens]|uniref:GLUG motif-containing protein n=1 Tax=Marinoscillum furvescens DSM 4134 TaxID=1122208 RepID=A0A3D9L3U5_MARFU|nr:hypothetical protein [Marinoscillum furvescens]RED98358.1 hypothetical protein C7460_11028 [Marinoscillum furvescens DSM 4134]
MKEITKINLLFALLILFVWSCKDEEVSAIDPMIDGILTQVEGSVDITVAGSSWNSALVGLRSERLRLVTVKDLIESGGYETSTYKLAKSDEALASTNTTIAYVESKMDSIWDTNITQPFESVDDESLGVINFGSKQYTATSLKADSIETWLYLDSDVEFTSIDMASLQSDIAVLQGLSDLDGTEVQAFVDKINADYAQLEQDYPTIANEVQTAPEFSKAQKDLYAGLDARITAVGNTIENELSLDTRIELDAVLRDMYALTYFVDNNYTSPAQEPAVFGEISSITELRWFSEEATQEQLNNDWVLTTDIDAAETARWNLDDPDGRYGFHAILETVSINFDGQFHMISGLRMSRMAGPPNERTGVFNNIDGGSIRNLGLINFRMVTTKQLNGGQGGTLVGQLNNSTVSKCFVQGSFVDMGSQQGGFIGRPQNGAVISDCFAKVEISGKKANPFESSFIGLPVSALTVQNCYNLGGGTQKAIFGHGANIILTASGIYYDSDAVGTTVLDRGAGAYNGGTPVMLSDAGVVTDLPTSDWGNLSNFSGWSADTWEIRTEPQFDPNPRPYLKGFNYEAIADFIDVP